MGFRGFVRLILLLPCVPIFFASADENPKYPVLKRSRPLTYDNQYKNPKNFTVEMDGDLLGKCFLLEAAKFPAVTLDDVHGRYPRLFSYLKGSFVVDYATGNEASLRRMILAQPDDSVDPVMLFRWSMQLNRGQLFEAILTIHELLRNEARFYRDWVSYSSTKEQMRSFFNKLVDIRGDLEERGDAYNGDHRGSWYRIWGTMLDHLKMVAPVAPVNLPACNALQATTGRTLAAIKGTLTAHLAEWAKPIIMYGSEPDPRKAAVNQWGYDAMKGMIRHSSTLPKKGPEFDSLTKQCASRAYLVDQEQKDRADFQKLIKESQHPSHFHP